MSGTVRIRSNPVSSDREFDSLKWIFPEPRNYSIVLWDQTTLPATTKEQFRIVIRSPGVVRSMFKPPLELSLGEAYIQKDFDLEGDTIAAMDLVDQIAARLNSLNAVWAGFKDLVALPQVKRRSEIGRGPLKISGKVHSRERDEAAVRYHYDVGNDFYSIWLDRNMQYSCGYFPTGVEDLNTAQERKMEHICRKLRLKPGDQLLDIGCGWGGLIRYAAKKYGVSAIGVSLSEKQTGYANQRIKEEDLEDFARVEVRDYRDLTSGSFDKIVSVGMFEHVGRSHLSEYFSHVYRLLKPGGLFLNHGISLRQTVPALFEEIRGNRPKIRTYKKSAWQKWVDKSILGLGSFGQRYFFPDGELELISDVNLIGEMAGFEVRDIENLREHYALTIRNWVKNIMDHKEEIIRVTNEVTYRTWMLYFSFSAHGFETGQISVNQTLFAKPVHGVSFLPLTREDIYKN